MLVRVSVQARGSDSTPLGCAGALGCFAVVAAFGLTIGAAAFQYSLWSIFAKDVPWYADMIGGLFLEAVVIPLAVACWIARLCGVEVPFYS